MIVTNEMKKTLAEMIKENIKAGFENIHLSGNLMSTIEIKEENGVVSVDIPAEIYDMKLFKTTGAIIYTNEGSYAETVNKQGGYSRKHVGYAEAAIYKAIQDWLALYNVNGKVR